MNRRVNVVLFAGAVLFTAWGVAVYGQKTPTGPTAKSSKSPHTRATERLKSTQQVVVPQDNTPAIQPAKEEPVPAAGSAVVLTDDSLITMIQNLGYDPKTNSYQDGTKYNVITIQRGTWTFVITVELAPNKSQVWLSSYFGQVEAPEKVPSGPLFKLLEANNNIWPTYFTYVPSSKGLYAYRAVKNADVKPSDMRNALEALMGNIQDTSELWDISKWVLATADKPAAGAKPASQAKK